MGDGLPGVPNRLAAINIFANSNAESILWKYMNFKKQDGYLDSIKISKNSISFRLETENDVGIDRAKIFLENEISLPTNTIRVVSSSFIRTISALLNYTDLDISFDRENLKINNFSFKFLEGSSSIEEESDYQFSYSKEQWNKLKQDTFITCNNYWKKEALSNVSVIQIIEGKPYNCAPGIGLYKFGNVDATIDTDRLERNFGHDCFGVCLKNTVIELFDNVDFEKLNLGISDERKVAISINGLLRFTVYCYETSSSLFKKKLQLRAANVTDRFEIPENISNFLKAYWKSYPLNTEDLSISIKKEGSKTNIYVEDGLIGTFDEDCAQLSMNFSVLVWILDNLQGCLYKKDSSSEQDIILFKKDDSYYIALNYAE